jgi:hypothetical protein
VYNRPLVLELNKGSIDAGAHSKHGKLIRCDIKPRSVDLDMNRYSLYEIYVNAIRLKVYKIAIAIQFNNNSSRCRSSF